MQDVSFKARIRPVSLKEFTENTADIYRRASVEYPWTAKETIKTSKAYTTDILDCTAGGIIDKNGKNVILFHICPTQPQNFDFETIEKHIMAMVESGKEGLQGFLLGSQKMYKDSEMMFKKLHRMLTSRNIPTSTIKGSKEDKTHILYNAAKDEWLISNWGINQKLHNGEKDSEKILKDCFEEVKLSNCDTFC